MEVKLASICGVSRIICTLYIVRISLFHQAYWLERVKTGQIGKISDKFGLLKQALILHYYGTFLRVLRCFRRIWSYMLGV